VTLTILHYFNCHFSNVVQHMSRDYCLLEIRMILSKTECKSNNWSPTEPFSAGMTNNLCTTAETVTQRIHCLQLRNSKQSKDNDRLSTYKRQSFSNLTPTFINFQKTGTIHKILFLLISNMSVSTLRYSSLQFAVMSTIAFRIRNYQRV
jgi:hypothetical protein